MSWPVAERPSTRRICAASLSVGVIFSIEARTTWTLGKVWVRSPLPSLVTMIDVPVSATRKLAPVRPTSAERKRSRRIARASPSSCSGCERSRSRREIAVDAAEVGLDVVAGDVDRRRDDVRGRLAAQLDDIFAEVGLDRIYALPLEGRVEADLLGDHRLALGHHLGAARLADAEDDRDRFVGVARVMHAGRPPR